MQTYHESKKKDRRQRGQNNLKLGKSGEHCIQHAQQTSQSQPKNLSVNRSKSNTELTF